MVTVDHEGGPRQAGASGESANPGRGGRAGVSRLTFFGEAGGRGRQRVRQSFAGSLEFAGSPGLPGAGFPASAARHPELLTGEHEVAAQGVKVDDLLDDGAGVLLRVRALGH